MNTASKSLDGKVVMITGGGGGMGSCMALGLIGAGARVAAIDLNRDRLEKLAEKASQLGGEGCLLSLLADITRVEECEKVIAEAMTKFGKIHALANNAGIGMQTIRANYMNEPVRFWEVDPERWQRIMDVNWKGAFLMARSVAPHLIRQGSGRIINVTTSLDTMYRTCYTPYGMSKAALEAATASWAKDLENTGVTVNVLVPGGPTNTTFIPEAAPLDRKSLIQPQVMVAPICWLVSDASEGFTGCRFVASLWDTKVAPDEAAKKASSQAAWQQVTSKAVWPGAR
ncbi:MAG: SDR family oxidoreductase [Deltaproteobacteria bacterium]|nr:SDR family oxidoreductase [Deltaproteobacteria bacterium]